MTVSFDAMISKPFRVSVVVRTTDASLILTFKATDVTSSSRPPKAL